MKIAAIICEYNPFHNGHKYQIDKTREILGKDCLIVAIMSGNFTQRGDIAICDKSIRAKAAVMSGVNLVLELPFPYSMSSAEFFAKAGVHIAEKLSCIDYLVFGTECDKLNTLTQYVNRTESEEFKRYLFSLTDDNDFADLGYPKLYEKAYNDIYGLDSDFDYSLPNNILAIEYLRALRKENSSIIPFPIKRMGAGYNDDFADGTELQSASAIRKMTFKNLNTAFNYTPISAKDVFFNAIQEGALPADCEKLSSAVIAYLRLNPPTNNTDFFDTVGGLYNRLHNNSFEANSISSLTALTETKKFTRARIRRAVWNSFFGVTSSDIASLPAFTQILAMDEYGRLILKRIPKMADFHIFTKPSDLMGCDSIVLKQKELSRRADSVYGLCLPNKASGNAPLRLTPFVKK